MHTRYRNKDELNERRRNHAWTSQQRRVRSHTRTHTRLSQQQISIQSVYVIWKSIRFLCHFFLFFFRFSLLVFFRFYRRRLSLHLNPWEPFFFILSHWIMYMEWIVLYIDVWALYPVFMLLSCNMHVSFCLFTMPKSHITYGNGVHCKRRCGRRH